MTQQVIQDLLARRRDRAIATLLTMKEREIDPYLPKEASGRLRQMVLQQINDLHDMTLDILRSFDDGSVVLNELYLQKLDELHEAVVKNGS